MSIELWAPDDYPAAYDGWRQGWGDLPFAAYGRPVPALVQLGVLAHAPWPRLDDLRHAPHGGRARRAWGSDVLDLVDRLLEVAGTPDALTALQNRALRPTERRLLDAGRQDLTRVELAELIRAAARPTGAAA